VETRKRDEVLDSSCSLSPPCLRQKEELSLGASTRCTLEIGMKGLVGCAVSSSSCPKPQHIQPKVSFRVIEVSEILLTMSVRALERDNRISRVTGNVGCH